MAVNMEFFFCSTPHATYQSLGFETLLGFISFDSAKIFAEV